jgi:hypothetical protein
MADGETEAAITLAVMLGALGRCETCGATWSTGEVDSNDEDSLDVLEGRARDVTDPELLVFEDDQALRDALARVIDDAAPERACSH